MQVVLNVDELQFKEMVDKSLLSLPPEKLQEILLEAIKQYLTQKDVIEKLFVYKNYNSCEPTPWLKRITQSWEHTDELADIRKEVLDILRDNYKEALMRAASETFLNGLIHTSTFYNAAQEMAHIQKSHERSM